MTLAQAHNRKLSFIFPWTAYYTAEALELSGIVAIMMAGIVMALFMKRSLSERAERLTAALYKVIAQIAETYVFVYLGMAFVSFPIFDNIDWSLIIIALLACFVGRLHIFVGSVFFNCGRNPLVVPKPITPVYMFVMWFSGLRGGVAFALASVSYGDADFPARCGGLDPEVAAAQQCRLDDSTAILQTTIMIAAFTIFVFGGTITDVAKASGILKPTSKEGIAQEKKEAYFNKRTDLWTQIEKQLTPYLASCKHNDRIRDREHVRMVLEKHSSLAFDERGAEWFFRQENEWALAEILEKITKVQGRVRGTLLRRSSAPTEREFAKR